MFFDDDDLLSPKTNKLYQRNKGNQTKYSSVCISIFEHSGNESTKIIMVFRFSIFFAFLQVL